MKISLIQTSLQWEDHQANRQRFSELISQIEETNMIILPEMFATGFTMNPEAVAETMDGESVKWMQAIAVRKQCAVTGSLVIKENGNYYNRLFFVYPNGEFKTYNKRHLFTLAGEHKKYTAGSEKLIVEYEGWKICPLVCYDLRFPVFARNVEGYDLLLFVANWPSPRVLAWDVLLQARAVENMCYVAGVNRVGQDSNGHNYPGHSQVFDSLGKPMLQISDNEEVYTVTINKEEMLENRKKLGFLNDRDSFILQD